MAAKTGLESVGALVRRSEDALRQMEEVGRAPNNEKALERRWTVKETAELVGRSSSSLLKVQDLLITQEKLDPLDRDAKTNRVRGYTLRQINQFREHFKTFPRRDIEKDPCLTLAIQSFKGGVGKTITSVLLSQYLATQGYRVLLIDMDSQASATCSFGYMPDKDIADSETLLPFFKGEQQSLDYCIRKTYWDNLDIVPANLQLYRIELDSAEDISDMSVEEKRAVFNELKDAIETVQENYDIVIMDSPPALGFISMNILCAADAFIVPTPPGLYEFSSTAQYFKMIKEVLEMCAPDKYYKFIKILATDVYSNQTNHKLLLPVLQDVFGNNMMKEIFFHVAEIGNAGIDYQTALEVRRPQKRALSIINNVCKEIEFEIWKTWPSKFSELESLGQMITGEENVTA